MLFLLNVCTAQPFSFLLQSLSAHQHASRVAVELESSAAENEESTAAKLPQVQRLLRDFPDHKPSALLACIKVAIFCIVLNYITSYCILYFYQFSPYSPPGSNAGSQREASP
jgi:hypothetical protein